MVEITRQVGTWPKIHGKWPATQELYQTEEDISCQATFQEPGWKCPITSTREVRIAILEWKSTGLLDLSRSADWRYQTTDHWQTLGSLLERLSQLSLGRIEHSHQHEQGREVLSLPTLIFPPQRIDLLGL